MRSSCNTLAEVREVGMLQDPREESARELANHADAKPVSACLREAASFKQPTAIHSLADPQGMRNGMTPIHHPTAGFLGIPKTGSFNHIPLFFFKNIQICGFLKWGNPLNRFIPTFSKNNSVIHLVCSFFSGNPQTVLLLLFFKFVYFSTPGSGHSLPIAPIRPPPPQASESFCKDASPEALALAERCGQHDADVCDKISSASVQKAQGKSDTGAQRLGICAGVCLFSLFDRGFTVNGWLSVLLFVGLLVFIGTERGLSKMQRQCAASFASFSIRGVSESDSKRRWPRIVFGVGTPPFGVVLKGKESRCQFWGPPILKYSWL